VLAAAPAAARAADAGDPAGPLTHVVTNPDLTARLSTPTTRAPSSSTAHAGRCSRRTASSTARPSTRGWPSLRNAVGGAVSTTVDAGGNGLRVVQNDSYRAGQDAWRTDVTVTNSGGATRSVTVYRVGAATCRRRAAATAFADGVNGGGGCACPAEQLPADRVVDFVPISAARASQHDDRRTNLWSKVAAQGPLLRHLRRLPQRDR